MSWVDLTWPMLAAASLVLGLVHGLVWLTQLRQRVHLAFALAAVSVAVLALLELQTFHALSPNRMSTAIRWMYVPVTVMVVSLLYVVHQWFGLGSPVLAAGVAALRVFGLILDFSTGENLNFISVDGVGRSEWWGATISHPIGDINPWVMVSQFSNALLLIYLAQTMLRSTREPESVRRAALIVCGSWFLLVVLMMSSAAIMALGLPRVPLAATPSFVIVVVAMSYRLSNELFRTQRLSSQLQQSERRSLLAEAHLELAATASGIGLWSWDVVHNSFRENANNRGLLGNPGESACARDALFRNADPDDRLVRHEFDDVLHDDTYQLEYRVLRPDGERRWISVQGNIEHDTRGHPAVVRGITRDVTRRKGEETLLRTLLEAAPSALLLIDADGRVRCSNIEGARVFGYEADTITGIPLETLVPGAMNAPGATERDRAPRPANDDSIGVRKDGEEFPVEVRVSPLRIDDTPHAVVAVSDLTSRRRMEHEVAAEREGLAHLSRVTMLGELSGSLAHELNQPLAAILSNAQAAQRILRRDPSDIGEVQEILADIVENDRRAGQVIDGLRGLLKKETREYAPLDVNVVVQDCMRLMRNDLLNRRVVCRLHLAPGLPTCLGDRIQLQQVLLNLLINACDALPDEQGERTVLVRTSPSEIGVCTEVVDSGTGIPADMLERIFTPFESTKTTGMGMGLAVCRTIIRAHGGRIWVENAQPRGARACFDLPRQEVST
ncbi:PAS domain S-box protein [Lysobacter sp. LF1]|uniref:histidine kinase n=1 Tax=Lysobacter stagni TaxID=3045172 RepID=A0ABT6XF85_9GAMM|nr:ATP-binding protein [Lysobacter sp. LF1]MDI9238578.1 PAS domain S-box protein [Lysobacter sp. LF1]